MLGYIDDNFAITVIASVFLIVLILGLKVITRLRNEIKLKKLIARLRVDAKNRRARNEVIGNTRDISLIEERIARSIEHAKRCGKIVQLKKFLRKNCYAEKVYCEELAREYYELCKKRDAILKEANAH